MHVVRNIHDRLPTYNNQPRARSSDVHAEKLLGTLERDTESTRYVATLSTHNASPEDRATIIPTDSGYLQAAMLL